jgi:hypothetical protein
MLPADVVAYVAHRFAAADRAEALALLAGATIHDGSAASPRLVRCAAVASGGSMERLRMENESLTRDWHDVIVEGEYVPRDGQLVKVLDLDAPIPDDV